MRMGHWLGDVVVEMRVQGWGCEKAAQVRAMGSGRWGRGCRV